MDKLAKGTYPAAVFKLIKVLINTQQADFAEAVMADTRVLDDVVDQLETDQPLFQGNDPLDRNVNEDPMSNKRSAQFDFLLNDQQDDFKYFKKSDRLDNPYLTGSKDISGAMAYSSKIEELK